MVNDKNISRQLIIKGNNRAYTVPVYGEKINMAEHVYKEVDVYAHKITNEVIFYDKHTESKPKHHTLGIVKDTKVKQCKFTKGIKYDNPDDIFCLEADLIKIKNLKFDSGVNLWFTDEAYWHYLYEDLPVLKHFMTNNDPIVTSPLNSWQKELLNYFGEIKNRIVEVPVPVTIEAKSFNFYTETDAGGGRNSEWANIFIRDYLKPSKTFVPTKKIYISREDADVRKVTSEETLIKNLKGKGFEIIFDMPSKSIQEKIDMFAESKIVISVSGSTLCHVHAMQPDTVVIDSNHLTDSIQEFAFNNIGDSVGIKWYSILGTTMEFSNPDRARRTLDKDLKIETKLVDKILEQV